MSMSGSSPDTPLCWTELRPIDSTLAMQHGSGAAIVHKVLARRTQYEKMCGLRSPLPALSVATAVYLAWGIVKSASHSAKLAVKAAAATPFTEIRAIVSLSAAQPRTRTPLAVVPTSVITGTGGTSSRTFEEGE